MSFEYSVFSMWIYASCETISYYCSVDDRKVCGKLIYFCFILGGTAALTICHTAVRLVQQAAKKDGPRVQSEAKISGIRMSSVGD